MRTSEERVEELHRRMHTMKEDRKRRQYYLICAAVCVICCVAAVTGSMGVMHVLVLSSGEFAESGAAASIFADNAMLGYIVVALMAFILGITAVLFCFRLRKYMEAGETE